MFSKLFMRVDKSLFKRAWDAITQKPKFFMYIFLLDIGFFGIFWLLNYLTNIIIPADPVLITRIQENTTLLVSMILLFVAYVVILVLAYSFINLIIMGSVKSLSVKHEHDFSMLKNMFFLNILLFFLFFLILVVLNLVLAFIINKSVWITAVLMLVVFLLFMAFYIFYSFSHSLFIMGHELKDIVSNSIKYIFTRAYLGIFTFSIGVFIVYILLYMLAGWIFNAYILANYASYVNITSIISLIIVYILFSFNRIYFFFVAEHHVGHKKISRK